MDFLKSNLKGVIGSKSDGIPINKIEDDYFEITHSRLNYRSFGYTSIRSFLEDIPDVVKIIEKDGRSLVKMALFKNDPTSLKNLTNLIIKTSNDHKNQRNRNRIMPTKRNIISLMHLESPDNIVPKKDGNAMLLNRIKEEKANYLSSVSAMVQSNDQNSSPNYDLDTSVINESRLADTHTLTNGLTTARNGLVRRLKSETCTSLTVESNLLKDCVSKVPRKSSVTSFTNNNGFDHLTERSYDWGCWFLRPFINFNALYKQVKVLGVQSGQAVVVGVNRTPSEDFLKVKNVLTFFPGDITLWQPPFDDPRRPKGYVDIQTAFPVTVIKRLNAKKILVRVLGLTSLIEADTCDIFQLPSYSDDLSKIVKIMESRETTMLVLAALPTNIDIWDNTTFSGVYTVLYSIDEGGSILESNVNKGTFLNLILLNYIQEIVAITFNATEKDLFVKHFLYLLERSKSAIAPTYEKFISGTDIYPEGHPLKMLYSIDDCKDKMLIGCMNAVESKDHLVLTDNVLLRLKYSDKLKFCSVDDESVAMTTCESPLHGVYMLNNDFICSPATSNDPLRFKTALLAVLPSVIDVLFKLNI